MDEVIGFIKQFIQAEYEAEVARFSEPDYDVFSEKAERVDACYVPDLYGTVSRPMSLPAAVFEKMKRQAAEVTPRVLFEIRQYQHPKLGALYRCYLSDRRRRPEGTSYFDNKFVASTEEGLKIIASYERCDACQGSGKVDGERCRECELEGWRMGAGAKLRALGPLVERRKLTPPTDPQDLPLYEGG
jgi:hypothetical protein